jgi:hypothetical protein
MPRFLMNGIRFQSNFLGWSLVKTSGYGALEVAAKSLIPMVLAVHLAKQNRHMYATFGNPVQLNAADSATEVRRSSLTE